ncbi:hypothetical protein QBC37DRAFT_293148 [Rhypophila decipiens]|uniref:Uncharacterized protein n=1 Tax=Rhypophila decipiens TaxID=261697 RepID=A0AAN7B2B2_9PEZI|nr:hypothetical protein QBC37DRAFT_293148 [Rhypophila decipiens]
MLFVTFIVPFFVNHVLALEAPIPGYKVQEMTWKVDPFNNGTIVEITGTVQDVIAELYKINPQYLEHHFMVDDDSDKLTITHKQDNHVICNPRPGHWVHARYYPIQDGISYLRQIGGRPELSAGPGTCSRVSCSWKSAIWWCNDDDKPMSLDSFGDIADCAQEIVDICHKRDQWEFYVVGQNFNDGNWNCIVRGANC